jgi:hypothetical protein
MAGGRNAGREARGVVVCCEDGGRSGSFLCLKLNGDPEVPAYARVQPDKKAAVVVAINMSAEAKTVALRLEGLGIESRGVSAHASDESLRGARTLESVDLPHFASWVGEVK